MNGEVWSHTRSAQDDGLKSSSESMGVTKKEYWAYLRVQSRQYVTGYMKKPSEKRLPVSERNVPMSLHDIHVSTSVIDIVVNGKGKVDQHDISRG
jgi:hypothetical protein